MEIVILGIGMFAAGFIDSIAGGGGLISVPALLMTGMPPHMALGTNKMAASLGSFTSSYEFFKSNKLNKRLLKMLIPFAFVGAVFGVVTVQYISPKILEILIPFMIFSVAIYTVISKKVGMANDFRGIDGKNRVLGKLLTSALGFYDGFFGPGTGTFFMFGLVKIFKFDFTVATANTKVLNFTTGFAALLTFIFNGQVNLRYGLISAVFIITGSKMGSKMAIKNGAKFIKPIFVTMSLVMAFKMAINL
ncbi:TSUP family transporter [uncultured Ilyobacter sp.]|uniref:TSUP family transporter n=1 Tax=uncultured Ilyobacter sp. TaxID=544433 RepID=UPI0029C85D71|nr:TSUP family transporter [uncultured Ilyobacter sp.]